MLKRKNYAAIEQLQKKAGATCRINASSSCRINASSSVASSTDRAIPDEIADAAVLCLCLEAEAEA